MTTTTEKHILHYVRADVTNAWLLHESKNSSKSYYVTNSAEPIFELLGYDESEITEEMIEWYSVHIEQASSSKMFFFFNAIEYRSKKIVGYLREKYQRSK